MSDTYARVMRPDDGPGNRRTTRGKAARQPGTVARIAADPAGPERWDGAFRLVAYVRAEVEPEIAADPLLGEVGWSWLSEALDTHVPGYAVPSGTVTRAITEGFGAKRDELPLTGFELRASWSPVAPGAAGGPAPDLDALDLPAHIAAWCDCLAAAPGLEPPGTRA